MHWKRGKFIFSISKNRYQTNTEYLFRICFYNIMVKWPIGYPANYLHAISEHKSTNGLFRSTLLENHFHVFLAILYIPDATLRPIIIFTQSWFGNINCHLENHIGLADHASRPGTFSCLLSSSAPYLVLVLTIMNSSNYIIGRETLLYTAVVWETHNFIKLFLTGWRMHKRCFALHHNIMSKWAHQLLPGWQRLDGGQHA